VEQVGDHRAEILTESGPTDQRLISELRAVLERRLEATRRCERAQDRIIPESRHAQPHGA
jgi:hypothetical protein